MKNLIKLTGVFAIVIAIFAVTTAFTSNGDKPSGDNVCYVTVKYSSGSLAKSVKVTTDVSGGISCIGGRDFYTNDDGVATLKWSSGCYLKKVYVKGTGYKVDYKDGNSYTLVLN
ncbi:MAG: hypothetical protein CSB06_02495 [Bacteroidia bacterium]|nr:MAG: hypothetical protein CSB06_02495 [Bacteroidia bacterium]